MNERIQMLDDLGAEFARVAAEAERRPERIFGRLRFRSGSPARMLPAAVMVAVLLVGGTAAVPATRGAVGGIVDSFAGWVLDESDTAPGQPLADGDAPAWLSERPGSKARLITRTAGIGLYVQTVDSERGPWLEFWLGEARGAGATLEDWRDRLGGRAVVVLGYTPFGRGDVLDARGRAPLFGVTARGVDRVELRYSEGPPTSGAADDGGFVLLADAWRSLHELVAYDASGRALGRADLSDQDLRYLCEKDTGCPPSVSSRRGR